MRINQVPAEPFQLRIKNSFQSFFKKNFITNSLLLAIFLSIPTILENKLINTLSILIGFYIFLNKRHSFFWSGFFIGIFWFYWIGFSFKYYGFAYLEPVVTVAVGLVYGIIFYLIGFIYKKLPKFINDAFLILTLLFAFDFIKPFDFDWFKFDVLLVDSYFGISKTAFLTLLISLLIKYSKFLPALLVVPILLNSSTKIEPPHLKIKLISTNIPQEKKWKRDFIPIEVANNFEYIEKAIKENYDVVVLPESAFPLFLNRYPNLIEELKELSRKITIVTGSLEYKKRKFFNSTYIFENGKMQILNKHRLVPFGEYIPLPFFQKEINKIFFGGASDYSTAENYGIYSIKNYKFINAICYEATNEDIYKLKPKYIIALTNDAWFMPSTMPILQKKLIKLYAERYKKMVFHSINGYKSYIVNGE